jgi:transposase-like protein
MKRRYKKPEGDRITIYKLKRTTGKNVATIARELGVSRVSIYQACDRRTTIRNTTRMLLEKLMTEATNGNTQADS